MINNPKSNKNAVLKHPLGNEVVFFKSALKNALPLFSILKTHTHGTWPLYFPHQSSDSLSSSIIFTK